MLFYLENKRVNGVKMVFEWLEMCLNYIFSDIRIIICFVFIVDVLILNVIILF